MAWGSTERALLIALAAFLGGGLAWISSAKERVEPIEPPSLLVDANTAPIEVFGALPGLGPALSGRIIHARDRSPFASLDDLDRRVKGIGPAKAASIRPFLRFDPPTVPQP